MSYRFISNLQLCRELCKALHKPGLYISWPEGDWDFLNVDAPYLIEAYRNREQEDGDDPGQCLVENNAFIIFDTPEERDNLYNKTSGDESGGRVYAITINEEGQTLNENT